MKHLLLLLFCLPFTLLSQNRLAFVSKFGVDNTPEILTIDKSHEVGFELDGGMILVHATIDENEHTFILDSGAPGLILNNFSKKGTPSVISGLQGEMKAYDVLLNHFKWAGIHYVNVDGVSTDLSHLENLTNRKISGLIGYDLLKHYEVSVDYSTQKIQMHYKKEQIVDNHVLAVFPLAFWHHLPVIKVKIADKICRFGLDTGAEMNVVDEKILADINSEISGQQSDKHVYGLGHTSTSSKRVTINETRYKCFNFRAMEYIVADLSNLNMGETDFKLDGILGYPFLSSCHFAIDFENNVLKMMKKD